LFLKFLIDTSCFFDLAHETSQKRHWTNPQLYGNFVFSRFKFFSPYFIMTLTLLCDISFHYLVQETNQILSNTKAEFSSSNVTTVSSSDPNKLNESDNDKQLLQLAKLQASRFVFPLIHFKQNGGEFSDVNLWLPATMIFWNYNNKLNIWNNYYKKMKNSCNYMKNKRRYKFIFKTHNLILMKYVRLCDSWFLFLIQRNSWLSFLRP
jgi:hypothetical protein